MVLLGKGSVSGFHCSSCLCLTVGKRQLLPMLPCDINSWMSHCGLVFRACSQLHTCVVKVIAACKRLSDNTLSCRLRCSRRTINVCAGMSHLSTCRE